MNTVLKPLGMIDRMMNASNGPMAAPVLSSARCIPNEAARFCGCEAAVMSESRGAVRMPLPSRSAVSTAVSAPKPDANSSPMRATADRAYPKKATHFGWSPRSATQPPPMRTIALTPWYSPSRMPYVTVDSPSTPVT